MTGDGKVLLLEDRRWVVTSVQGDRAYGEIDVADIGIVGVGTMVGQYFTFHTIHEHVSNPITRMFAIDLEQFQLVDIGEGYCPIVLANGRVLYVENGPEYRLCQTSLPGRPTRVPDRKNLTDVPVAFIKPGLSEGEIIVSVRRSTS